MIVLTEKDLIAMLGNKLDELKELLDSKEPAYERPEEIREDVLGLALRLRGFENEEEEQKKDCKIFIRGQIFCKKCGNETDRVNCYVENGKVFCRSCWKNGGEDEEKVNE